MRLKSLEVLPRECGWNSTSNIGDWYETAHLPQQMRALSSVKKGYVDSMRLPYFVYRFC